MATEELKRKVEELESRLETVSVGQSVICQALENAGIMENGEPRKPARWDPPKQLAKWDPAKIRWTDAVGNKGPYQKCVMESTPDYHALLADLKAHCKKKKDELGHERESCIIRRSGFVYWLFTDKATIGRKKIEPKQKISTAVDNMRRRFPKDLADLLLFEEKEEYVVIRPRQYLGSDNFSKIATIVRDEGGEYVSAGKESHFRVPRGK